MSTFSLLSPTARTISIASFSIDPHMASSKTTLDDLRRRIDEIDDQLHDLVMKRTEIVGAIAREKKSVKVPALRPGREAAILRRLVARHHGDFSRSALTRMWREMLSVTVGLQTRFVVAVYVPDAASGYWDLARDHFGSFTPMLPFPSIGPVIRAINDGQASIGILPVPEEDDADPWWRYIVSSDAATPRILARLPFAGRGNARSGGDALAVGSGALEPTGDDRSLVVVETRGDISRARFFSTFAAVGLGCSFVAAVELGDGSRLNLAELDDFVAAGDARLQRFVEQVGADAVERIVCLGSYAAPLAIAEAAPLPQVAPGPQRAKA
jgi:chorismate mutase/prephenate dehydratase